MAFRTRLCDRFGIEHPIINAPMGGGDAPGASSRPRSRTPAGSA